MKENASKGDIETVKRCYSHKIKYAERMMDYAPLEWNQKSLGRLKDGKSASLKVIVEFNPWEIALLCWTSPHLIWECSKLGAVDPEVLSDYQMKMKILLSPKIHTWRNRWKQPEDLSALEASELAKNSTQAIQDARARKRLGL